MFGKIRFQLNILCVALAIFQNFLATDWKSASFFFIAEKNVEMKRKQSYWYLFSF